MLEVALGVWRLTLLPTIRSFQMPVNGFIGMQMMRRTSVGTNPTECQTRIKAVTLSVTIRKHADMAARANRKSKF